MFQRVGPKAFKKDLNNIIKVCEAMGNPQNEFNSIHIAGTNGKGSVAHMLAAVFSAAGYKTGLYTSPHYSDFRERVKIDGELIPKKKVISFVNRNKVIFEKTKASFFEWTVALAFDYFAELKVDIAIIETGLGGRLDSTNIITPELSVITNIGYDHMNFLGDTLPLIAGEKAGIIKREIPLVIGESQKETSDVFNAKAKSLNAPIYFADNKLKIEKIGQDQEHSFFEIKKNGFKDIVHIDKIKLQHLAAYQIKNLTTVLASIAVFKKYNSNWFINNFEKSIYKGLENLKKISNYKGRWEFISQEPKILIDSAHNEDGIRQLTEALSEMNFNHLHFVLGVVGDKSHDNTFSLLPQNAIYYFAKAKIPRGMDALQLQAEAAHFNLKGKSYSSVRKALAAAKLKYEKGDLIFVGGSIFTVAEVI